MLYTSDPIDPANPNAWVNTVRPIGEIRGLPGDREGQLVALNGGGFMLVGSDNIVPGGNQQPISAITASAPDGLLTPSRRTCSRLGRNRTGLQALPLTDPPSSIRPTIR